MKRRIPGLRRLFRLPSSERTVPRDVADEIAIAFHLESRSAELEATTPPAPPPRRRTLAPHADAPSSRSAHLA